jgi:hypothetical protein
MPSERRNLEMTAYTFGSVGRGSPWSGRLRTVVGGPSWRTN